MEPLAVDCLVCSGPLHTTWLGTALAVVLAIWAFLFVVALMTELDHPKDRREHPELRGLGLWAACEPWRWAWAGVKLLAVMFTPTRRPIAPNKPTPHETGARSLAHIPPKPKPEPRWTDAD